VAASVGLGNILTQNEEVDRKVERKDWPEPEQDREIETETDQAVPLILKEGQTKFLTKNNKYTDN